MIGGSELSSRYDGMAMLAKLRNTAPLDGHLMCFKVPELDSFHIIVFVPNTEDVEGRAACIPLIFSTNLSLDVGIPC